MSAGDDSSRLRQCRRQPPAASAAFADAAAFLERIGAARFEDVYDCDDGGDGGGGDGRRRSPPPPESLGRRLRNFLMRPRHRRRRQSAATASGSAAAVAAAAAAAASVEAQELQDYAYTRWVFHRGSGPPPRERSVSHDHLRCPQRDPAAAASAAGADSAAAAGATVAPAGASAASAMTKSASARIVRFRCPYDSVSSSDRDSTLVSPYLTSAFPCLPLPPGGSVSSGYSSDRETPPDGTGGAASAAAAAAQQHWATREEDIDCLLQRRLPTADVATAALPDDLLDVGQLDVPAFFSPVGGTADDASASCGSLPRRRQPQPLAPCLLHQLHVYDPVADEIDRLVCDVVRLGGATADAAAAQRQSWGSWQQPRSQQQQLRQLQMQQQLEQLNQRQRGWHTGARQPPQHRQLRAASSSRLLGQK